jgi:hypothetical protein
LGEQRTFVGSFGVAGTLAGGRTLAGEAFGAVFSENGLLADGAVVGLRFLDHLFSFIEIELESCLSMLGEVPRGEILK